MIIEILGRIVLKPPQKVMRIWTCGDGCDKVALKIPVVINFLGGIDSNPPKGPFKAILEKTPFKVMRIWTFGGDHYITFENPKTYSMHRKFLVCD